MQPCGHGVSMLLNQPDQRAKGVRAARQSHPRDGPVREKSCNCKPVGRRTGALATMRHVSLCLLGREAPNTEKWPSELIKTLLQKVPLLWPAAPKSTFFMA
eukprot:7391824-Prymnesium_polylepis.1